MLEEGLLLVGRVLGTCACTATPSSPELISGTVGRDSPLAGVPCQEGQSGCHVKYYSVSLQMTGK